MSPIGKRLLVAQLADEDAVTFVLHHLTNRSAMAEASFETDCPKSLTEVRGFEDLAWPVSSNPANHRLTRLELDEAAFMFQLVRSLDQPDVAELGRYKGGTTFLLAASGATVVSIDNDVMESGQ